VAELGRKTDDARFTCIGCGALSPLTAEGEASTTVTIKHGWRVRRGADRTTVEARCPACYALFKESAPALSAPSPASRVQARVSSATRFRSTWLSTSLAVLRDHGLIDRYLAALPAPYHAHVTANVAGVWLPVDVAVEHYRACDQLGLAPFTIQRIGYEVTAKVHGPALRMALSLASGLGATPWTALSRATTLWRRCWEGGGVSVVRQGPKEARLEIEGWPCAPFTYCRIACKGMLGAIVEPFCTTSHVREDLSLLSSTTLGFIVAWV
jgi:hypothetical protein